MSQSHKKQSTVDLLLELLDQLSAEVSQIEDLRREIQNGIDAAQSGELKPAEEVLAKLRKRAQSQL